MKPVFLPVCFPTQTLQIKCVMQTHSAINTQQGPTIRPSLPQTSLHKETEVAKAHTEKGKRKKEQQGFGAADTNRVISVGDNVRYKNF